MLSVCEKFFSFFNYFLYINYYLWYSIGCLRVMGRVERGSFTLTLSQNRAWKSPLTRLFTLNSLCIDITLGSITNGFASFIISSSLFKSCIITVAWVRRPLRSMPITDTSALLRGNPPQKRTSVRFCLVRHFRHFPWHSDFCFPRSANKPVSLMSITSSTCDLPCRCLTK